MATGISQGETGLALEKIEKNTFLEMTSYSALMFMGLAYAKAAKSLF